MSEKSNFNIFLAIIWILLFMAFPFSIPQAYNIPYKSSIVALVIVLICSLIGKWNVKVNSTIAVLLVIQISLALMWMVIHRDMSYINFILQLFAILIVYLSIGNLTTSKIFASSFVKFVAFTSLLATICFFLPLLFNLAYFSKFVNPDGRAAYNYIISFTNVYFDLGSSKIIRPSGFFDEPGALAFYITVAILVNDLTKNSSKIRILLFLTGIFTLSVAFYLMCFVYFAFQLKFRFNTLKTFRVLAGTFVITVIFSIAYANLDAGKQNIIYNFTVGRVANLFDSDSGKSRDKYFKANNRSDLIEISLAAIKDSPIIGQGLSYRDNPKSSFYQKFIGANLFSIFALHGIIGGFIFSLHLLYFIYTSVTAYLLTSKTDFLKTTLIYFFLLIQRPDYIGGILPYVVVIMLCLVVKRRSLEIFNVQNISYNSSIQ